MILVKQLQSLHAGNGAVPPSMPTCNAAAVKEVLFLQLEGVNRDPALLACLLMIVVGKSSHCLHPCMEGGRDRRAASLTIVVPYEQLAQEPRECGMNGEPGVADVREQPRVRRPLEQAQERLARHAAELVKGPGVGLSHEEIGRASCRER